MCGFSGFLTSQNFDSPFSQILEGMALALHHRGPDDSGVWYDAQSGIGLAHARLAIVDLSPAGHQPMQSACDRYVLAFNGEIYNDLELRKELESKSQAPAWRGRSDTETLLACFTAWGVEKTIQATVGMFAFALWDKQHQVLTLARDRLGEKPLYWGWFNKTLLFGSELNSLKVHPAFNAQIDRDALALLLRHNYIPAPHSIYKGIRKLPAGHYVQIAQGQDFNSVSTRAYWSLTGAIEAGVAQPFSGSDKDAVMALEGLISQSVAGQMLADVPLGAFLSGGVDSSTIVSLMQKQSSRPIRTFSIGFNEQGYNEAEYAKDVAKHLGTDHNELYVGANEALAVIPKLPEIYSEPFADSSQIPTFLVSQMAKRQITVALSGDGGDELFGGYNSYQFAPKVWNVISRVPIALRTLAAAASDMPLLPAKLHKLLRVLPSKDRESFYSVMTSHWLQPEQIVIGATPLPIMSNTISTLANIASFEEWMMAVDISQYMSDDILVKVDRAAMANSLETRVPLLDHRIVEFAWQLPLKLKLRNGKGKWILREVLYKSVPHEMIERPKKGFSIPLAQWLRGPLRSWAEALLDEHRLRREGYFNPQPVRKLWQEHIFDKRDNSLKLWSIMMFQAWLEQQ